jgi:hypothetical protein
VPTVRAEIMNVMVPTAAASKSAVPTDSNTVAGSRALGRIRIVGVARL